MLLILCQLIHTPKHSLAITKLKTVPKKQMMFSDVVTRPSKNKYLSDITATIVETILLIYPLLSSDDTIFLT